MKDVYKLLAHYRYDFHKGLLSKNWYSMVNWHKNPDLEKYCSSEFAHEVVLILEIIVFYIEFDSLFNNSSFERGFSEKNGDFHHRY